RKERVLAWLVAQQPDVLCLQETKVTDDAFPRADFEALGYHVTVSGQRTYNGVAILSRTSPVGVVRAFADGEEGQEARFLTGGVAGGLRVCVYAPKGQVVGRENFAYNLSGLGRLRPYLDRHCDPTGPLALCGDLNVAPEPRDVHDPAAWQETVLFHP